jgi:hypothetical protein
MIKKSNKIILSVAVLILCLATVPMFSFNNDSDNCEDKKSLVDLVTPTANAANQYNSNRSSLPAPVEKKHCDLYVKYRPFILEALNRYYPTANRALPILSPAIIGGLINEESRFGYALTPETCAGRADYRKGKYGWGYNGHGLAQADPSSGDGPLTVNWPLGSTVNVTYRGTSYNYKWNDCRDSIFYAVGHLIVTAEDAEPYVINKLKKARLNTNRKSNGVFVDPKVQVAYVQLILDANNAGRGGMVENCSVDSNAIVNEGCTANKHYGARIMKASVLVAKCGGSVVSLASQYSGIWR